VKTIYKYPLKPGVTMLTLRGNILSTGVQGGDIMVWAVHDDAALERQVRVTVMGTGHPFANAPESDFVGTVFLDVFVFHVFATLVVSDL
jgi:hypothetical protein